MSLEHLYHTCLFSLYLSITPCFRDKNFIIYIPHGCFVTTEHTPKNLIIFRFFSRERHLLKIFAVDYNKTFGIFFVRWPNKRLINDEFLYGLPLPTPHYEFSIYFFVIFPFPERKNTEFEMIFFWLRPLLEIMR